MTAAHLRRIDAPRFCRLDKQLNLFGGVLLVKEWECMCARADQRSSRRRAAVQAIAKNDQGLIGRGGGVGGSGGGDGDDGGVGGGDGGDGGGVVVGIGPGLLGRLVVVVASGPRQRRLP